MNFRNYTSGSISFDIPDSLKIVREIPEFYAVTKKSKTHLPQMLLLLDPPAGGRQAAEGMMTIPLPQTPELRSTDIRRGRITHPYQGYERITEDRVLIYDNVTWIWWTLLYPHSSFIDVQVSGIGDFEQAEPIWQRVIDSIRLKPETRS